MVKSLFTETWNAKSRDVSINGFKAFVCPRPKWNKKAKRDSGGLKVYYKHRLENKIELIKTDRSGKLWIKLKRNNSEDKNDVFICLLYIPPKK